MFLFTGRFLHVKDNSNVLISATSAIVLARYLELKHITSNVKKFST